MVEVGTLDLESKPPNLRESAQTGPETYCHGYCHENSGSGCHSRIARGDPQGHPRIHLGIHPGGRAFT